MLPLMGRPSVKEVEHHKYLEDSIYIIIETSSSSKWASFITGVTSEMGSDFEKLKTPAGYNNSEA